MGHNLLNPTGFGHVGKFVATVSLDYLNNVSAAAALPINAFRNPKGSPKFRGEHGR
jgi:hypothetical protein